MNNNRPTKYFETEFVLIVHADVIAPDQRSAAAQVQSVIYKQFPATDGLNLTVTLAEIKPLKVAERFIPHYHEGDLVVLFQTLTDIATKDGNTIRSIRGGSIGKIIRIREFEIRPITVEWINTDCVTECEYYEFEMYQPTNIVPPKE